eukprot:scaffold1740_cov254-Pinguiococcus_pyrenoidosus.AAC.28
MAQRTTAEAKLPLRVSDSDWPQAKRLKLTSLFPPMERAEGDGELILGRLRSLWNGEKEARWSRFCKLSANQGDGRESRLEGKASEGPAPQTPHRPQKGGPKHLTSTLGGFGGQRPSRRARARNHE